MRTTRRRRSPEFNGGVRFVLDVGTDAVRAAVVTVTGPQLLGVATAPLPWAAMERGAVANIDAVIGQCEAALVAAGNMAGYYPVQGVIGVGSETAHTVQIEARFVRRRPQSPISQGEWTRWQAQARAQARAAGADLPAERTGLPVDLDQLHETVMSVYVDGHRVDDPRRFQGTYVQLVGVYTYAPKVHTAALRTVARRLGLKVDMLASPPWLMARYAGQQLATGQDVLLADVGAGITDVALAGSDGPVATVSFPYGGRDFTGAIRNRFGITYDEAESVKLDYASGLLDPGVENTVALVLDETFTEWAAQLDKAVASWSMTPTALYVGGGSSNLPQFRSPLQLTTLHDPLPVKPLRPHDMTVLQDPQQFLTHENQLTLYWLAAVVGDIPN